MRGLLLVFGITLFTASTAIAAPADISSREVEMQALLDPDGSGRLFVTNTDGPWHWETCTPQLAECRQAVGGRELSTHGIRPPAVFRVESGGMIGISPEWRGRVVQIAPPSTSGTIRANEFVSPMPGRWARGWEKELSELQLAACLSPKGKGCTALTHPNYVRRGCAESASFVIGAKFAGQYLRVAERHLGAGPVGRLDYGLNSPYGQPVWRRDAVTSVAVIGRIDAPTRGFPGECGPPVPSEGSISRDGRGLVRCSEGCRATLTAARAGRMLQSSRPIDSSRSGLFVGPPERIAFRPGKLAHLGHGSITVTLRIDGLLRAKRVIRAGT